MNKFDSISDSVSNLYRLMGSDISIETTLPVKEAKSYFDDFIRKTIHISGTGIPDNLHDFEPGAKNTYHIPPGITITINIK